MPSRFLLLASLLALVPGPAWSQQTSQTRPVEAIRDNTPRVNALTDARIVVAPDRVLEDATLVLRDGVVEAVGSDIEPPPDARVRSLAGHTLYPGFIDAHADLGFDEPPEEDEPGPTHWNVQVRSWFSTGARLDDDEERRAGLRSQGFATALAVPRLGIFRGRASVVNLGEGDPAGRVVRRDAAHSVTFASDRELAGRSYPNSSMGVIALIRQTLLDADWHRRVWETYRADPAGLDRPERSEALAALEAAARGDEPLLFEARREEEYLRTLAIADEFPVRPWIRGSGEEYRILDVIRESDVPLVVPLNFPDEPDVESPEDALDVSLAELRHWYRAPENPARLASAGVPFSLTADGLDDPGAFLPNLRVAVDRGLDRSVALAALTTRPARLLGIDGTHGTLEPGKVANVVVVEGDLFDEDSQVRNVWIEGERHVVSPAARIDPRGEWLVGSVDDDRLDGRLTLRGELDDLRGSVAVNGREIALTSATLRPDAARLRVAFPGTALGVEGVVRLSASIDGDTAYGWSELPDGIGPAWRAERSSSGTASGAGNGRSDAASADDGAGAAPAAAELDLPEIRPAMEYGREGIPEQPGHVLVRGATVWTQGPQGRVEDADLLVRRGEIVEVGQDLDAPSDAVVVDGSGRHVTPGLIDAHLHSGTHGVNESGHAIVPEVRLGDVVTHNNIWTYRQLAGGLTAAHVMHGSANPIGGQNVFVKMRWGALPDGLELEDGPRTVKFALGENPKRRSERYPDTRMGTQEIIRDHFRAARDYRRTWERWKETGEGLPPRTDLRMEALLDILDEELRIHSHGYRQDEFLALVRLAEEFGFSVQALQHGVEAYKIAPELAESDVAAVVWSDWGAFKIEAYDNTVYNARLLTEAGVLTSLHSDNSQLASRMNWEAGKMVRAGMDEEDALALVTSATARVFGVDDRIGSLEPGKDADFVVWNGHPLSQFTRAEQTWIDGRKYFDLEEDRELRRQVERERAQLIQILLEEDAPPRVADDRSGGSR